VRLLSSALLAAARDGTAAPLARLEVFDTAPRYAPVYTDGPAGRGVAAIAPDGALAQAYHDGARTVYARRVPDPTVAGWGPWSVVAAGAAPGAGVALSRLDGGVGPSLLWQDAATGAVYAADPLGPGAGWGAGTALFSPGTPLGALAADGVGGATLGGSGGSGNVFVAYPTASNAWRVAVWSRAGDGTWRGADWTNGDVYAIAGLSTARRPDGSYLLAAAVRADAGSGAAIHVYTYDGRWSLPATVVPADLGAGAGPAEPRLSCYDGLYHLAYAVDPAPPAPTGAAGGRAAGVALAHALDGTHWTNPLPLGANDVGVYAHGATPLAHPACLLLTASDAAALAPYPPSLTTVAPTGSAGSAGYRDVSADVSHLEVIHKDGDAARLVVTVQHGAAYAALPALRPNVTLRLSFGYRNITNTRANAEAGSGGDDGTVPAYVFLLDDWSLVRAAGEDELVLTASDRAAWLDRQSPTTLLYSDRAVGWLVREVTARAGLLAVDLPATPAFAYTVPTFSIPAGSTWRAALTRLARLYGFDAAARTGADGTDTFTCVEKSPADAPVWSYGSSGPAAAASGASVASQLVVARSLDRANHALVFGAPAASSDTPVASIIGEAWDRADMAATGQERYLHTIEPLITTSDGAALRAARDLQREARRGYSGSLSAPLHPGLELWDVIAVDGGVGPTPLRVATLHLIYEPHPGTYDMVVTCEGV